MLHRQGLGGWAGNLEGRVVLEHPAVLGGEPLACGDRGFVDDLTIHLQRLGVDQRGPGVEDVPAGGVEPPRVIPGGAHRHPSSTDRQVLTSGDGGLGGRPHPVGRHAGAAEQGAVDVDADQWEHGYLDVGWRLGCRGAGRAGGGGSRGRLQCLGSTRQTRGSQAKARSRFNRVLRPTRASNARRQFENRRARV